MAEREQARLDTVGHQMVEDEGGHPHNAENRCNSQSAQQLTTWTAHMHANGVAPFPRMGGLVLSRDMVQDHAEDDEIDEKSGGGGSEVCYVVRCA